MIWPILEARAEIQKYFRSFLGTNVDIQKSSWNYLTFSIVLRTIVILHWCNSSDWTSPTACRTALWGPSTLTSLLLILCATKLVQNDALEFFYPSMNSINRKHSEFRRKLKPTYFWPRAKIVRGLSSNWFVVVRKPNYIFSHHEQGKNSHAKTSHF